MNKTVLAFTLIVVASLVCYNACVVFADYGVSQAKYEWTFSASALAEEPIYFYFKPVTNGYWTLTLKGNNLTWTNSSTYIGMDFFHDNTTDPTPMDRIYYRYSTNTYLYNNGIELISQSALANENATWDIKYEYRGDYVRCLSYDLSGDLVDSGQILLSTPYNNISRASINGFEAVTGGTFTVTLKPAIRTDYVTELAVTAVVISMVFGLAVGLSKKS